MNRRMANRVVAALAATVVALPLAATATASTGADVHQGSGHKPGKPGKPGKAGVLARDFTAVDRDTVWTLTRRLALTFPTFHTEGLAIVGNRIFLSAVEIIEPTVKYPEPHGRYDRTPGKGVGHVFVIDRQGHLKRDIVLGHGNMYHPGGMDYDGHDVWVPVAQYRPNSSALLYRINAKTLAVHQQFRVKDHIGGIVHDRVTGRLVGNNWGSRRFYEWTLSGDQRRAWDNPSHFVDYQDCQYVARGKMLCGGVTNLPQTPVAGGPAVTYELGGLALIDLTSRRILHEVPFQQWSTAGHVATRNPIKLVASGKRLRLWVAPDNGDEGNGTELLTYEAKVSP
jgi:Family of unknown function (DUF6454)